MIAIAIAGGIAHQEKEATVPVRVDPDLIADQGKNIETITSIETIGHTHTMENTPQTPDTEKIPLINNKRTIDKDLGVTHLPEIIATAKTICQIEEDSSTKKDQTVVLTHFTQKLMLSIYQNLRTEYQTVLRNQAKGTYHKKL